VKRIAWAAVALLALGRTSYASTAAELECLACGLIKNPAEHALCEQRFCPPTPRPSATSESPTPSASPTPASTTTVPPATTATTTPTTPATATVDPSALPTPRPRSIPFVVPSPIEIPTDCTGAPGENPKAQAPLYFNAVRAAFVAYRTDHKDQFNDEGNQVLFATEYDDFYDGVVAILKANGYEAWVDDCGGSGRCGEIQVSARGTARGSGFTEGYSILTSSGHVRDPISMGGYRGRCTPKFW
jgi:hypothetical protein